MAEGVCVGGGGGGRGGETSHGVQLYGRGGEGWGKLVVPAWMMAKCLLKIKAN